MRSACTAADTESPLPSASGSSGVSLWFDYEGQRDRFTWVTRLADLSSSPIKIVTFSADPIARLMFDGAAVSGVQNRRLLY